MTYTGDIFDDVHVYYLGTTPELAQGYEKLIEENLSDRVQWHPKKTLNGDMLEVLSNTDYEYVTIVTDDCIFYRPVGLTKSEIDGVFDDIVNHFTFRCGTNTNVIDYMNHDLTHTLNYDQIEDNVIRWNWTEHTDHYGYPCALDASMFKRDYLYWFTMNALPEQWDYRKWECDCHQFLLQNHGSRKMAIGTSISSVVNVPCNMVSTGPYCKNGEQHSYTTEELNDKYLNGEVIDLKNTDFSNVVSVQQELQFKFRKLDD